MIPLTFCHFKNLPIFDQLQMEEAILRAGSGNWCIINEGSPKAIVMGISGKPEELIESQELVNNPMPVIRRFSGGGTVVVEENTLFVTFILSKEHFDLGTCPKRLLDWTGLIYHELFSHTAFQIRENDYAIGDKKIGGNAQYFAKDRYLHHTSFLWDFCPKMMQVLKMPPKMPEYRSNREHEAFLTKLMHHFESKEQFIKGLKTALEKHFIIQPYCEKSVRALLDAPHRKALTYVSLGCSSDDLMGRNC